MLDADFHSHKIRAEIMKKRSFVAQLVVVTVAFTLVQEGVSAQGPGGNAGRGGAAAANAGDRVQGQINQRAQAQVQQRVQTQTQAQVQSRVQGQMQGRIQAEAKRAAEVAQRGAEKSARRNSDATGKAVSKGAALQGNAAGGGRGNNSAVTPSPRANAGLAIASDASRFNGFAESDVAIYDNIFGRFNPIRQNGNAGEIVLGGPEINANGAARRSSQAGERANPNAPAGANARGLGPQSLGPQSLGPQNVGPQNVDLARGIQVAAQQRRAEIAEIRDQAIATGQTDLLSRADEMELRLDAFVEAQQQLDRGRSGQTAAPRTASRLNGSTPIQN